MRMPRLTEVFIIREDVGDVAVNARNLYMKFRSFLKRGAADPDAFVKKLKHEGYETYLPGELIDQKLAGVKIIFAPSGIDATPGKDFVYLNYKDEPKVNIPREERDNWLVLLYGDDINIETNSDEEWWELALPQLADSKEVATSFYHEIAHLHQFDKMSSPVAWKKWKKDMEIAGGDPGGVEAMAMGLQGLGAFAMDPAEFRKEFPTAQSLVAALKKDKREWQRATYDIEPQRLLKYVAKSWQSLSKG